MKNPDYKPEITIKKGGKQFVNIISSAAFSSLLVVIIKELTDKNFQASDIQSAIDSIQGTVLILIPIVSTGINMVANIIKHYWKKV